MAFTLIRVSPVLVAAILATSSTPVAAQALNKTDAQDFQMFRHSIALRLNGRVCERVPEYAKTFGEHYDAWSAKHRAEITRGEALFTAALNKKDQKGQPSIDRATLENVEERLAELAKAPGAAGPTPPPTQTPSSTQTTAAQTAAACEKVLTFLKGD